MTDQVSRRVLPLRFEVDHAPVPPDREPPEGGWQPHCKVQDHLWKVEFDGPGGVSLVCVDPCSEEKLASYEPNGVIPGCDLCDLEELGGETEPFKLRWHDDSVPSTPAGPAEYGGWFEVVNDA